MKVEPLSINAGQHNGQYYRQKMSDDIFADLLIPNPNVNAAVGSGSHAKQGARSSVMYVNYGCGFTAPKEWMNFDASPTLRWERIPFIGKMYTKNARRFPPNVMYGDIVEGLPVPDGSCRGVYASHILEQLTLDDFHRALDQTKKILQARGIFRLVIPDLEWAAREYVTRLETGDPTANNFFLNATCLGKEARRHGLTGFVYNLLRKAAQWMWDELSLEYALEKHGFIRIRKCSFGDCEDPMFALVEDRGRFEHAIAMEARVPQHDSR